MGSKIIQLNPDQSIPSQPEPTTPPTGFGSGTAARPKYGKMNSSNNDGGGPMDPRYTTKKEFNEFKAETAKDLSGISAKLDSMDAKSEGSFDILNAQLTGRFDTFSEKLDGKIDSLNGEVKAQSMSLSNSVNSLKESIPDKISIAITNEFDKRDRDRKENNRYIFGTLILGIISIIVSLLH